jgi:hypothetical protein
MALDTMIARTFFINAHENKIHIPIITEDQHILAVFFKSLSFILNIFKKFLKNGLKEIHKFSQ